MTLTPGFHSVPRGHVATVVTHLEMTAPVALRPEPDAPFALRHVQTPDIDWYRALFRRVGAEDWLWFSRLAMAPETLAEILHDPGVQVFALIHQGREEGLLELDFRDPGQCELAFFGLARGLIGQGAGRWLMNRALERAWAPGITRLHVHTCTLDSPQALDFYRRSGFVPYRQEVEVLRDPRQTGLLPDTAAPHVPLLR